MKIALSLALPLAMALALDAQAPLPQNTKVVTTTLSAIRKSPDAYRSVWVRFNVQFASLGKISNPFFTQFEPSRFANFYSWADEQAIWKKGDYEDLFGFLFVNKEARIADKIYRLSVYDRVEVVGVIRNVFQGKPWIEVKDIEKLSGKVNTATLSHIFRGESLMKKRTWKRAIAELSMAPAAKLPDHVLGQIHKNLAVCYLRLGETGSARTHIENALDLVQGLYTDPELQEIARTANVRPEEFLDRAVTNSQVQDYQRPMWEAFASSSAGGGAVQGRPAEVPTQPAPAPRK